MMTKSTHTLSGIILAQGYLAWLNFPMDAAYLGEPEAWALALPIVASCVGGAIFPDVDIRIKLFGHRTITHWFPPFLIGAILAWLFFIPSAVLFCAAVLLHILLDAFTKMGVPVWAPFGRRHGFRIFVTGGIGEGLVVSGLLLGSTGIWCHL